LRWSEPQVRLRSPQLPDRRTTSSRHMSCIPNQTQPFHSCRTHCTRHSYRNRRCKPRGPSCNTPVHYGIHRSGRRTNGKPSPVGTR
jgi:hypothetical protein